MRLSPNCKARQGEPNRFHTCSGCDCGCHGVACPPNFRELIEAAKNDLKNEED